MKTRNQKQIRGEDLFFLENTRFWRWRQEIRNRFFFLRTLRFHYPQSNLLGSQTSLQIVVFSDFGSPKKGLRNTGLYKGIKQSCKAMSFALRCFNKKKLFIIGQKSVVCKHFCPKNGCVWFYFITTFCNFPKRNLNSTEKNGNLKKIT